MSLDRLLPALSYKSISGNTKTDIREIQYDSRLVQPGDIFVAVRGFQTDGHNFIEQAVKRGAVVVVAEKEGKYKSAANVLVDDSRLALAQLASAYYDHPSSLLSVVGVTGTNGKTTVSYWIRSILETAGAKTGLIGTVKYFIGKEEFPAVRTTPESLDLQALLRKMVDSGVDTAVMEVSSHALELKRVQGIDFKIGVFTNLSREHLDFHQNMENYQRAKGMLFTGLGQNKVAVLNGDDPVSQDYARITSAQKLFYSLKESKAEYFAKSYKFTPAGTEVVFSTPQGEENYRLKLTGEFNLSNFGAVLAAVHSLDLDYDMIRKGAENFTGAPGRMERVDLGQNFNIWIDYAHTPDGMGRVFSAVRSFTRGRLICLFGCGGDRDRGKRPQMGKIAEEWANQIILSSDNPRSEDPAKITEEIVSGMEDKNKVRIILDRKEALEYAVGIAKSQDSLLVTGKGHENYQEVKGVKYSFNERQIIEEKLIGLGYSGK
ncbi:MAG: UDP-N-acetylmuramoyl-L-alanyl-D-glutamate--2,6-diaminopimelate ligase [candidate division Zixibacteria bacterium RBG_16_50_21]|nr:MAG: UDP-N-acetylmuramoyl-L-alanyl-D-glutamate--2,6-diaminopimelate ligase [candidate division Zixibacteria bacterium RBG_16_50_21]